MLSTLLTMLVVSVVIFVLIRSVPGDPVRMLTPPDATPEVIEATTRELGLDQPLYVQYVRWFTGALRGDLGRSIVSRGPVLQEVTARYPTTFSLAVASTALAVALGVALGVLGALYRRSAVDTLCTICATLGVSFPGFWIGLILILVFSVELGWLPSAGAGSVRHLLLPATALGVYGVGVIARLTRTSVADVLPQDFVRTARAKGQYERVVIYRHVLRNALIPVITIVGLIFAFAMTHAVAIEALFAYPGMGKLLIDSILLRDYPVIQGVILLMALTYCLVNLGVDVAYSLVDPRISFREQ